MPLFVRKLGSYRRWDDPMPEEEHWLGGGDLRADALKDVATDQNVLSVYEIDDASGISVPRILAALAAGGTSLSMAGCVVFDSSILDEVGIAKEREQGETYDNGVNTHHINLVRLTAERLATFGARIRARGHRERFHWKEIKRHLNESIKSGYIDASLIAPSLRKDL